MRNRPHVLTTTVPDLTRKRPPMALLLRYMMTPRSGDRVTDHRIMGRTLQVLYDGAILSGVRLQGTLIGTDEALKVTLAPITLEERARVWYAIQKPYRLSVTYEVRVVNLDSEDAEHIAPVAQPRHLALAPSDE
jgi:Pvc16 N-terminal domain